MDTRIFFTAGTLPGKRIIKNKFVFIMIYFLHLSVQKTYTKFEESKKQFSLRIF